MVLTRGPLEEAEKVAERFYGVVEPSGVPSDHRPSENRLSDYRNRCQQLHVQGLANLRHYPATRFIGDAECADPSCDQPAMWMMLGWTAGGATVGIPVCAAHRHGSEVLR